LSHTSSPLCYGYFDGVSQTICLGWPQNLILSISASWIARITGVSHQYPALGVLFLKSKNYKFHKIIHFQNC
jgi:hypothetical protein